jgi:DNA-binding NtrC family response regulator
MPALRMDKEIFPIPKKRVMVVDDDDLTCRSLSRLIENEGCEVITVENGIKALEKFKENRADIIITDLKIPEMNGLELMEEVMKISSVTAVIIMTGYYLPEIAREAKEKGAFDFIEKPLRLEKVLEVIKKALSV